MMSALTTLLVCQLIGEVTVRALALPLPGPVVGMGLLFLALLWRGRREVATAVKSDARLPVPESLLGVTEGLIRNLSLLFVPAAVGITQHIALVSNNAFAIVASIVVSTLVALIVTALVFHGVTIWLDRSDRGETNPP